MKKHPSLLIQGAKKRIRRKKKTAGRKRKKKTWGTGQAKIITNLRLKKEKTNLEAGNTLGMGMVSRMLRKKSKKRSDQ